MMGGGKGFHPGYIILGGSILCSIFLPAKGLSFSQRLVNAFFSPHPDRDGCGIVRIEGIDHRSVGASLCTAGNLYIGAGDIFSIFHIYFFMTFNFLKNRFPERPAGHQEGGTFSPFKTPKTIPSCQYPKSSRGIIANLPKNSGWQQK